MRGREFRPQVSDCLEARSLLSGIAIQSHQPVVLPRRKFVLVAEHMESSFSLLAMNRLSFPHIRQQLRDVAVIIPFGRVDGLGSSINRILNRLRQDLSAGVPRAISAARDEVIAVTREAVQARVRAGDVVVR